MSFIHISTRAARRTVVLAALVTSGLGGCETVRPSPLATGDGAEADEEELGSSGSALTLSVGGATLRLRNASPPGTRVAVSGSGFSAGEEVRLTLDDEAVGEGQADDAGNLDTSFEVSAETLPGVYLLRAETALGGASGSERFAVRTDFAQGGFNASQTRHNPYENVLDASNVGGLVRKWRSGNWAPMQGRVTAAATRLFAVSDVGYPEFDDDFNATLHRTVVAINKGNRFSQGSQERLWFGLLGPGPNEGEGPRSVAAAYGSIYAGGSEGLLAFPQDCRTDGERCTTFWSGHTGGLISPPTVYRNVVYVQSGGRLYAFPSSCAASSCGPLWNAASGGPWWQSAAVYKNRVYVLGFPAGTSGTTLSVYPVGCRTDGGECAPLWQSPVPGATFEGAPVLANDRLFLPSGSALHAYRYDCGAGGQVCAPLWKATGRLFDDQPSVANGVVYANGIQEHLFPGEEFGGAAWPVDCRSDGGECSPLWRSAESMGFFGPSAVTNDLVISLVAYDAHCASDGRICPVLWNVGASPNGYLGTATVSDGMVYIPAEDNKLYAFGLPH